MGGVTGGYSCEPLLKYNTRIGLAIARGPYKLVSHFIAMPADIKFLSVRVV